MKLFLYLGNCLLFCLCLTLGLKSTNQDSEPSSQKQDLKLKNMPQVEQHIKNQQQRLSFKNFTKKNLFQPERGQVQVTKKEKTPTQTGQYQFFLHGTIQADQLVAIISVQENKSSTPPSRVPVRRTSAQPPKKSEAKIYRIGDQIASSGYKLTEIHNAEEGYITLEKGSEKIKVSRSDEESQKAAEKRRSQNSKSRRVPSRAQVIPRKKKTP